MEKFNLTEIYSSTLDIDSTKLLSNRMPFEASLREALHRNFQLLREYSVLFKNISRKQFILKVHKYIDTIRVASDKKTQYSTKERKGSFVSQSKQQKFQRNDTSFKKKSTVPQPIDRTSVNNIKSENQIQHESLCPKVGNSQKKTVFKLILQDNIKPFPKYNPPNQKTDQKSQIFRKISLIKEIRRKTVGNRDEPNQENPSKTKIVWVGKNQNFDLKGKTEELVQSKPKQIKIRNWLVSKGSGGFRTHHPDFFVHKNDSFSQRLSPLKKI